MPTYYPLIAKVEFESKEIKPMKFNIRAKLVKIKVFKCESQPNLSGININKIRPLFLDWMDEIRKTGLFNEKGKEDEELLKELYGPSGRPYCIYCLHDKKVKKEMVPGIVNKICLYTQFKWDIQFRPEKIMSMVFPGFGWREKEFNGSHEISTFLDDDDVKWINKTMKQKQEVLKENDLTTNLKRKKCKMKVTPYKITKAQLEKAYNKYISRRVLKAIVDQDNRASRRR